MDVRFMMEKDLEVLKENLQTEFDSFWTFSVLQLDFHNPASSYLVAIENEEIVGFACIGEAVDCIYLNNIVIKKKNRNLGIATKILEKLIQIAKSKQIGPLTLEVNEKNSPAIHLYENFGFQIIGRRKKYYHQQDDAILMTLYF